MDGRIGSSSHSTSPVAGTAWRQEQEELVTLYLQLKQRKTMLLLDSLSLLCMVRDPRPKDGVTHT